MAKLFRISSFKNDLIEIDHGIWNFVPESELKLIGELKIGETRTNVHFGETNLWDVQRVGDKRGE